VVGALLILGQVILFVTSCRPSPPTPAKAPALLRVADTVTLEPPPPPTDERLAFREAILSLEKLRTEVRAYPNEIEAQAALVQEALRAGDLLTARAVSRAALRLGPQSSGPLYDVWGDTALRLGLIEEAEQTYRAFIRHSPQEVRAHLGVHRVLNKTGQKATVTDVLKRALRALRPDDIQGRLMLVQEYERAGLLLFALEETESLHKVVPDNPQAMLAVVISGISASSAPIGQLPKLSPQSQLMSMARGLVMRGRAPLSHR
jgi:tetratricopeptide (TPR) repeat protein